MGPSGPSGPAGLPDAITFEGADPNIPQTITVTGTLTDGTASVVFPTLIFAGYTFGGTAPLYTSHGGTYGLPNEYYLAYDEAWELVKVASGAIVAAWVDDSATADITAIDNDFNPQGTAVGYPEIITGLSLQGTYLGQLCLASGGWWKWNGDAWEEEASGGGGGVTDHGLLAGLGDDDHTQYFNQTRGDARYPSITYAGANPNHPQSLTLTGVDTAGVNGTLVYCGLIYGKAAWSSDGSKIAGLANPLNTLVSSGAAGDIWLVQRGDIYAANKASTAATPAGLTGWTVGIGSGQPVIAASISAPSLPVGTHIGQFCQASGGLWRWNGSAWFEVTATASSISNAAVLAALPSTSPLPIASGGTGGATQSAAWTGLGGAGTITSPTLAGLTVASGDIATSQPLALTQTWSTTATYTGLRVNVTDSGPSNAASLLMDLQVGGVTLAGAAKTGEIYSRQNLTAAGGLQVLTLGSFGFNSGSRGFIATNFGGTNVVNPAGNWQLGWSPANANTNLDLALVRDAANTLAQRNGANAQESRIYGTFTNTSNYRRVSINMTTAGVAAIKPEGLGTGASGNVLHISGIPTSNPGFGILWNDAGTLKIGT